VTPRASSSWGPWLRRLAAGLVAIVATSTLSGGDVAADIYVYTDENGVMHFTNTRRPGGKLYVKS